MSAGKDFTNIHLLIQSSQWSNKIRDKKSSPSPLKVKSKRSEHVSKEYLIWTSIDTLIGQAPIKVAIPHAMIIPLP